MEMVFVKPASGGRVRQPERQMNVMPESGAYVPLNSHYERLLATGDIERAEAPQKSVEEQPAPTTTQKPTSAGRTKSSGASED